MDEMVDAVFIGAFVPASNPLSGLPDNCLVMATEGGGIYVAVKQDKVEIKGDVEVQGKVKVRDGGGQGNQKGHREPLRRTGSYE